MSRGRYLNIADEGNYDPESRTLTLYAVTEDGGDDFGSLYADGDFASVNANHNAADGGVDTDAVELVFSLVSRSVIHTAKAD